MVNAHRLSRDEIEVLRGLKEGSTTPSSSDRVWNELASARLVERRGSRLGAWSLTMRGRFYRTD
jgi:hypothetical protein